MKPTFQTPGDAQIEEEGAYLDRMLDGKLIWPKREIPGWPEQIRIRPLGRGVEQRHQIAAAKWCKAQGLDTSEGAGKDIYEERAAVLTLFDALLTADSEPPGDKYPEGLIKRLARDFDHFYDHPNVTDIFINLAWREYEDVKRCASPWIEDLPEAMVNDLVEQLKKNPRGIALDHFTRPWLLTLVTSMASRLHASTGSSHDTSTSSDQPG